MVKIICTGPKPAKRSFTRFAAESSPSWLPLLESIDQALDLDTTSHTRFSI